MAIRLDTIFSAVSNYKASGKLSGTDSKEIKQMFASDRSDGTSFLGTKSLQELMNFKDGLVNLKIKNPGSAEDLNDVIEKVNDVAGSIINREQKKPESVLISQKAEKEARVARRAERKERKEATSSIPRRVARTETLPHSSVTAPVRQNTVSSAPKLKLTGGWKSTLSAKKDQINEILDWVSDNHRPLSTVDREKLHKHAIRYDSPGRFLDFVMQAHNIANDRKY